MVNETGFQLKVITVDISFVICDTQINASANIVGYLQKAICC